jgi:arylsulfatase A-like enzyme
VLLGVGILGSLVGVGCGGGEEGRPRKGPPNLLVITIDTLRRDVMAAYGGDETRFELPITPALDALAVRGTVLADLYTTSPRTTQSVASLLTGLHPDGHGAVGLFHELPDEVTTLAEVLAERGYTTEAVVTNIFLRNGRGFEQGFTDYDDALFHRQREFAEDVVGRIDVKTLDAPSEPFFMWVHFLDPHWPYTPPPELLNLFHRGYRGRFRTDADLDSLEVNRGSFIFENHLDEEDQKHLRRRYLAEVRYTDGHVKRMIELLRARGYLENTLILVVSDHGESLGEHDYHYAHGEKLYQPTVHIPGFLAWPNGPLPAGRFEGMASIVDLMPTVLDLLGVPVPDDLDGVSLAPAIRGEAEAPRSVAYIESDYQLIHEENPDFHGEGPAAKWRAVVVETYKLIRIPGPDGTERLELYDLAIDPHERTNLADTHPDIVDQILPLLREFDAVVDTQGTAPGEEVSDAHRARLRSLGYMN